MLIKFWLIGFIGLALTACGSLSASSHLVASDGDDSMSRTGIISADELLKDYNKFRQQYEQFTPQTQDLKNVHRLKDLELVVFFGLWCHDSQREVSRLLRIIQDSEVQFQSLKLIALNPQKQMLPEYQNTFKVAYTPTIFALKNGQIVAQIIEKPSASLVQDLLSQILH